MFNSKNLKIIFIEKVLEPFFSFFICQLKINYFSHKFALKFDIFKTEFNSDIKMLHNKQ